MQLMTQKQKARYNVIAKAVAKVKADRLHEKRGRHHERQLLKQMGVEL